MRLPFKRVLICACLLYASLQLYAQPNRGALFIIGGGSRPDQMIERLISESGLNKGGYGVILPMSSSEPDSSVYYAKLPFYKIGGVKLVGLQFKKGELLTRSKLDSVRKAKLIYITGGDQDRFMDVVHKTDIEKAIWEAYGNGSLIAGTSAGAAVMSKIMITGNELKHKEYNATFLSIESGNLETKEGLGLIDVAIIDQHFLVRSRYNRLISAIIEFPELKGIGIDESTALLVRGNQAEVIGESQIIVFENINRSREVKNGKMSAKNVQMNIYLPGDTFTLK